MSAQDHLNPVQFYHGTVASFAPGDVLTPKGANDFGRNESGSGRGFVYMTADQDQAWNYAYARAEEIRPNAAPHVYEVEPLAKYEEDPNDSYDSVRTRGRVRVIGERLEASAYVKHDPQFGSGGKMAHA